MRKISLVAGILLMTAAMPMLTVAHGSCAHEAVHTYGMPGGVSVTVSASPVGEVVNFQAGTTMVNDTEMGDCDGDGVPGDFDGDLDVGISGFAFGHGAWAEACGYHVETAGSVTVMDFLFGSTVTFVTGSVDSAGPLTCTTDGLISPSTDFDDCISNPGVGTQPITCPGGADGLLWGFILGVGVTASDNGVAGDNLASTGTASSP